MDSIADATIRTDVLIVGAGPVGLALRLELERLGMEAFQIDEHPSGLNTSRAAVIHARTLEVLESCGVVPALLSKGIKVPDFRVRDGERVLLHVNFAGIASSYPYALMCPQNETEAIFQSRLDAIGAHVKRPARFVSATEVPEGVIAELALPGAKTQNIYAKWIVGCDGVHSTVREKAGIEFLGDDYPETFVLADVRMNWPLSRYEVSLFFSPQGLVVVAPLPEESGESNDRYRIVATRQSVSTSVAPAIADVQDILDERGPPGAVSRIEELIWSSSFHVQHRLASQVFKGRVLLCGDAAHAHSPAGGQGMNTGIQDAVALAEHLLLAVRHGDVRGLESWALRRHEIASEVVRMTDVMTRVATVASPTARSLRNAVLGLVGHIPFVKNKLATKLAELKN